MNITYSVDRLQQKCMFEGRVFTREQILALCLVHGEDIGHRGDLFRFLAEWFDDGPTIAVRTSGSTGTPKVMHVEKDRMIRSACLTCSFLGLQPKDKALLCMSLQFIGAKMLVVRALVAGLDVYCVAASTHPFTELDKEFEQELGQELEQKLEHMPSDISDGILGEISGEEPRHDLDFAFVPMTPQQAWGCLETPEGEARLRSVRHLLLGGMAVNADLQARLADFPHAVWSSYGMTETLSHIAIRRVNNTPEINASRAIVTPNITQNVVQAMSGSDWFTPFTGVNVYVSETGSLCIHAPAVCEDIVHTTDLAEIAPDGRFRILGRADTMVNSGGIKIQIEAVEDALRPYLLQAFQITALPDAILGEQLILLTEYPCPDWRALCSHLPKYWKPKQLYVVSQLPCTDSGKVDRYQARILAKAHAFL